MMHKVFIVTIIAIVVVVVGGMIVAFVANVCSKDSKLHLHKK